MMTKLVLMLTIGAALAAAQAPVPTAAAKAATIPKQPDPTKQFEAEKARRTFYQIQGQIEAAKASQQASADRFNKANGELKAFCESAGADYDPENLACTAKPDAPAKPAFPAKPVPPPGTNPKK